MKVIQAFSAWQGDNAEPERIELADAVAALQQDGGVGASGVVENPSAAVNAGPLE